MPSHLPPHVGDDVKVDFGDAGCVCGRVVAVNPVPAQTGFTYDIFLAVLVSDNRHTVIRGIRGEFVHGLPPYKDHL